MKSAVPTMFFLFPVAGKLIDRPLVLIKARTVNVDAKGLADTRSIQQSYEYYPSKIIYLVSAAIELRLLKL